IGYRPAITRHYLAKSSLVAAPGRLDQLVVGPSGFRHGRRCLRSFVVDAVQSHAFIRFTTFATYAKARPLFRSREASLKVAKESPCPMSSLYKSQTAVGGAISIATGVAVRRNL